MRGVVMSGSGAAPAAARAAGVFRHSFGGEPAGVWHAPGRVNLIGEHTDYNDGFVLPFALGFGVRAAAARVRPAAPGAADTAGAAGTGGGGGTAGAGGTGGGARGDRLADPPDDLLELCSRQAPAERAALRIGALAPGSVTGWAAYAAGVAWALREAGYDIGGARLAIDSDLPQGAGLSSSAALECAVAVALTELYGIDVPPQRLAQIARRAENAFVGVPSGIMDQSAAMLGRKGHALLLDCRTLATSQVPFDPGSAGLELVVTDTRVRHDLTDGAYADRRHACEEAARQLGLPALRDVTDPDAALRRLTDPVLRRRARHIITDNHRVQAVAGLLRAGAMNEIGALLNASHLSLRDDFEISWPQADVAVTTANAAGALGARMIGGGFGGSVIALVPAGRAGAVTDAVAAEYARRGWAPPQAIPAAPEAGAHRIA
jgi:galactokinase